MLVVARLALLGRGSSPRSSLLPSYFCFRLPGLSSPDPRLEGAQKYGGKVSHSLPAWGSSYSLNQHPWWGTTWGL